MNRSANWGVPSHSYPDRSQVSRIVGGIIPAAAVAIAIAMPGASNQGRVVQAVKQIPKPQVELTSRVYAQRPPAGGGVQNIDITAATESDVAQPLSFTDGPAISQGITEATETDVAQALSITDGPSISQGITNAAETDVAQPLSFTDGPAISQGITEATETDVAQALSVTTFSPPPARAALQGHTNQGQITYQVAAFDRQEAKEPEPQVFSYVYNRASPLSSAILQGSTNQGYKVQAPKAHSPEQFLLGSRLYRGAAPVSGDQNVSITPAAETDVAQALSATDGPAIQKYIGPTNEIKRITISDIGGINGTFTLTFNAQTTAALAYNATAAQVQTALEGLSNIDPGDVQCMEAGLGGAETLDVFVEFQGAYLGQDLGAVLSFATTPNNASASIGNFANGGQFATETDVAQPLSYVQDPAPIRQVVLQGSTNQGPLQPSKAHSSTQFELGSRYYFAAGPQSFSLTPATETDTAQVLSYIVEGGETLRQRMLTGMGT